MLEYRKYKAHIGVELLASDNALNPRSLDTFSLTIFLRESKSDVNKPVSSPTYKQIQESAKVFAPTLSVYTIIKQRNKMILLAQENKIKIK